MHRPSGVDRWNGRDGWPARRGDAPSAGYDRYLHRKSSLLDPKVLPERPTPPLLPPSHRPRAPNLASIPRVARVAGMLRVPPPCCPQGAEYEVGCHQWQCGGEGRGEGRPGLAPSTRAQTNMFATRVPGSLARDIRWALGPIGRPRGMEWVLYQEQKSVLMVAPGWAPCSVSRFG